MQINNLQKYEIPDSPGVYFFKKSLPAGRRGEEVLYIGKATYLKNRIKSYFSNALIHTRGSRMVDMVNLADSISFEKTDSVLEALILEANLIRKFTPKYNVKEKDNKSYNFVVITDEEEPKVVIERGRSIDFSDSKYQAVYGPFPSQEKLQVALDIIRKIFPFKTNKNAGSKLYTQIGLEVEGEILKKNIKNIKLFFSGKKKDIISNLKKEMKKKAKEMKFEEAGEIKRQIYALTHINDVALISSELANSEHQTESNFRIESYDIAHMSGKNSVGVMTVIENGVVKKSEYKKFILRDTKRGDDIGGLREIITRRFKHQEWKMPDLIVVDGGKNQLNMAKQLVNAWCHSEFSSESSLTKTKKKILNQVQDDIRVVSVLKDEKHKPKDVLGNKQMAEKYKKEILIANNESHRFAINFFRQKGRSSFLRRQESKPL